MEEVWHSCSGRLSALASLAGRLACAFAGSEAELAEASLLVSTACMLSLALATVAARFLPGGMLKLSTLAEFVCASASPGKDVPGRPAARTASSNRSSGSRQQARCSNASQLCGTASVAHCKMAVGATLYLMLTTVDCSALAPLCRHHGMTGDAIRGLILEAEVRLHPTKDPPAARSQTCASPCTSLSVWLRLSWGQQEFGRLA